MSIAAILARSLIRQTSSYLRPSLQRLQFSSLLATKALPPDLTLRLYGRKACVEDPFPRCSPKSLAKSPCMKRKKKEKSKEPSPFKSLWYNPECCQDPCPDMLPRFDDMYYKPSDKAKRKYQMTWVECPRIKILPKKVCCFDQLKRHKFKKRSKKDRPKTACGAKCPDKKMKRCPKLRMPRCRSVREPPRCHKERGPSHCKKVCAPYPAFSECKKPKIKPRRPTECNCLRFRSMCEAWAYLRKRGKKM